jgi:integrase
LRCRIGPAAEHGINNVVRFISACGLRSRMYLKLPTGDSMMSLLTMSSREVSWRWMALCLHRSLKISSPPSLAINRVIHQIYAGFCRHLHLGLELYWFADRQGVVRVMRRTSRKKLQGACRRIKATIHTFRHHFISKLTANGFSPQQAMKLSGHASVSSLMQYSHLNQDEVPDKALEILNEA